jgi:hypothetical protein
VFDPRFVEDVLDRDLVTVWREEDAMTAAENRRRAAGKAALARARKSSGIATSEWRMAEAKPRTENRRDGTSSNAKDYCADW